MGRGRSKVGGGFGGGLRGPKYTGELDLGGDDSHIEFDGTLQYGANDPGLTGKGRQVVEDWEKKRVKAKIEYAYAVDGNGNPVGREIRGGKGSVSVPISYHNQDDGMFTHIHPRQPGVLGGTFSDQDLYNFANGKSKGTRAAAKEGTYAISKNSNFDKAGFKQYVAQCNAKFNADAKSLCGHAKNEYKSGKIGWDDYKKAHAKAANTALVNLHNAYAAGAKKYGYNYTLEQRK